MAEKAQNQGRLAGRTFGTGEISLNGDKAVTLNGQSWTPDQTKGYIKFRLSFAFPNVNKYGEGLHASVIARSYQSMRDGWMNSAHSMENYGAHKDELMGAIVAVEFPEMPGGGWKTGLDKKSAPFITGVSALWLSAAATRKWVERFETKRKQVAVSMEVLYRVVDSGFAVARNGNEAKNGSNELTGIAETPAEFFEAGWEYAPIRNLLTAEQFEETPNPDSEDMQRFADAADKKSLLRTRNWTAKRQVGGSLMGAGLVGNWNGRDVYLMQGGVAGEVCYPGMGIVEFGAEPGAAIEMLLAADEEAAQIAKNLGEIENLVKEI